MLCFNNECPMCDHCLRYQVGVQECQQRLWGRAVYPSALKDGKCSFYRKAEEVKLAYGFHSLYKNVPKHERSLMRNIITDYVGSVGSYYRYHNGEHMLAPCQQQTILGFFAERGYDQGIAFDHYLSTYNYELRD
ncbi:MAG: hypothetical protein IJV17_05855 [Prevotella sp.]|nr:hypothetical protein [Prevotella sp.]